MHPAYEVRLFASEYVLVGGVTSTASTPFACEECAKHVFKTMIDSNLEAARKVDAERSGVFATLHRDPIPCQCEYR